MNERNSQEWKVESPGIPFSWDFYKSWQILNKGQGILRFVGSLCSHETQRIYTSVSIPLAWGGDDHALLRYCPVRGHGTPLSVSDLCFASGWCWLLAVSHWLVFVPLIWQMSKISVIGLNPLCSLSYEEVVTFVSLLLASGMVWVTFPKLGGDALEANLTYNLVCYN